MKFNNKSINSNNFVKLLVVSAFSMYTCHINASYHLVCDLVEDAGVQAFAGMSSTVEIDELESSYSDRSWNFLKEKLNQGALKALADSNPSETDLRGHAKAVIIRETLYQDQTFRESSVTPRKKKRMEELAIPYEELKENVNLAQLLCSPLKDVRSSWGKHQNFSSPVLRSCGVSRLNIEKIKNEEFYPGGEKSLFTGEELTKKRTKTAEAQARFQRLLSDEEGRETKRKRELEILPGHTRASFQNNLKLLREGATERAIIQLVSFMIKAPSRDEISSFFIAELSYLFTPILGKKTIYYFNPSDIDCAAKDDRGRSNYERLTQGLNIIDHHWHHLLQDDTYVLLIHRNLHENPALHPFNSEGSQIDRKEFNAEVHEVNRKVAHQLQKEWL